MATMTREMQQCIDTCNTAIQTLNECLAQHIGESEMKRCLELVLDCRDVTGACVQMLARESDYVNRVCGICADLCDECARECDNFDSEVCKRCAQACRRCAEECRRMAA